ncbi:DciA family protein [Streptomyces sp. NPDC052503]|uniref:DciA family protein n=1 Tax=Streptomyces sp. NPDC052503 TaxID=3156683 RepID=UPI00136B4DB9|nr:DciA family protein [Streptomyces sp. SID7834]MYT56030.1 DUF721 domain-containing protein [Streptomyces sp. SID7834]MYT60722.1 DUF721 domain-containing protein [Streptomyces sp. SID7834]
MTTEPSGVDFARQALLAAREAAKKGATSRKPKRCPVGTVVRRDGREPLGLGSAISRMLTARGLSAPAASGTVLARFNVVLAAVAPELAGRIRAVGFDADTGRLDVVKSTPAAATKLRWTIPKLVAAANTHVLGGPVRAVHVLAPTSANRAESAGQTSRHRHLLVAARCADPHSTRDENAKGMAFLTIPPATVDLVIVRKTRPGTLRVTDEVIAHSRCNEGSIPPIST